MLSKWVQPFTPLRLFAAGEQGVWFDPSDFGSMSQDSAGTTPVTTVGQPVGMIRDKSGRGNHATQATTASRPLLQQDASGFFYLSFDGVDDGLATGSIDLSATNKATLCVGVFKATDASTGAIVELGAAPGAANGFGLASTNTGGGLENNLFGTSLARATVTPTAAPFAMVVSSGYDIAQATVTTQISPYKVNGVALSRVETGTAGTGNFVANPLFIGRRGGTGLPFTGRVYSLIVRGAASSAAQIAQAERFVGSRMGITL